MNSNDAVCVATALALCLNMLSDTDTVCVATGLALYLKQKKNRSWTKDHSTHTHKQTFYDTFKTEWAIQQ